MSTLTDLTSKEFLTALASSAPAPGGGGGAAMAGALAAALSSMVANLTLGKEKFAPVEPEIKELLAAAEEIRQNLLMLVEEDAAVFNSFMSCYKLPKATEAEKVARTAAIRNAAKQAAEVPLAIAGIMSDEPLAAVNEKLEAAKERAFALGVSRDIDPFMTLSFMALPVIPTLRITTRGVFDVSQQTYV